MQRHHFKELFNHIKIFKKWYDKKLPPLIEKAFKEYTTPSRNKIYSFPYFKSAHKIDLLIFGMENFKLNNENLKNLCNQFLILNTGLLKEEIEDFRESLGFEFQKERDRIFQGIFKKIEDFEKKRENKAIVISNDYLCEEIVKNVELTCDEQRPFERRDVLRNIDEISLKSFESSLNKIN